MIKSDRLILLPIEKSPYIEEIIIHQSWLNDQSIVKWRNNKKLYNTDELIKWYEEEYNSLKNYHFRIYKRHEINPVRCSIFDEPLIPTDKWIGMISLQKIDLVHSNAEIAFYIGNTIEHNKGYISEAINVLVEYAFNQLGLHRVYGATPNPSAMKAFEKTGFTKEGEQFEAFKLDGKFVNHCNYYILNKN
jgi:ribosomal-protein-alanine N-acetyltransferase